MEESLEGRLAKACQDFFKKISDISGKKGSSTVILEARVDSGGLRYVVLKVSDDKKY